MPNFFKTPLDFCLLIPCFNDEPGLIRSLQTVQYKADRFAVVIVDDGSHTAVAMDVLQRSLPHFSNIHLIRLEKNQGITAALNAGLQWIGANTAVLYIARLDCRDTCHPQRFYKQVDFLNAHAEVGLLGSWCTFTDETTGAGYAYITPLQHGGIVKAMHLRNVFIHPGVMFRMDLVGRAGPYPYDFPHAEDYAFFWRLLRISKGAVLGETLTYCAILPQGLSLSNRRAQLRSRLKVVQQFGCHTGLKILGIIKLNILLMVPKTVLLRLKIRKATV